MPNKKTKKKPANGKGRDTKRRRQSSGGGFFHFIFSSPMRQIIIAVIIIALLAIFWDDIQDATNGALITVGWGLIFIVGAVVTLIALVWQRKAGLLFTHWNRWLGGIFFLLAAWGILSTIDFANGIFTKGFGGSFGRDIIDWPNWSIIYGLRIFALVLIGVIFIAPRPSLEVVKKLYYWLADRMNRQPARPEKREPRPPTQPQRTIRIGSEEKPAFPSLTKEVPTIPPELARSQKKLKDLADKAAALKANAKKVAEPPPPAPAPAAVTAGEPSDLRQVASDVWKKYGQSKELSVVDGWSLPPVDILDTSPEVQFSEADNLNRARLIEETLASYGVDTKVVQINAGPTVTQFGVEPGWDIKYKEVKEKDRDGKVQTRREELSRTRVKVERINSLSNDLSLALAAPTIRIEAPVPGKTYVGVEVPNMTSDMVSLRGVVETPAFQKLVARTKMAIALGKGAGGEAISADLSKMPHLLVAGATGSGKTVCLNTIICCLLMNNTPNDVRFILIDPKRVELVQYNSIPHLATPVIVDTARALGALRWLRQEMDERYKKLAAAGSRHIEGYNKDKKGADKLPYLVLVIDELADLMMAGYDEVETNLCRLAQLARATGIHLVVATQRPSVDVVTGLIKANFPTRISFAVTSQVDSRTILDGTGAEKLLGRGDMLYMPTDAAKPKRLQGCFLSDTEIERLVYFWGSQKTDTPDKLKMETLIATTPAGTIGGHPIDNLLEQAKELARQHEDVSTSFLQRRLHIGYPRAARLKEQLDAVLAREAGNGEGEQVNDETFDAEEEEEGERDPT